MYYPMDVDDVPAASGSRPDRLLDVSGPQERVQRRTMEQIVDYVPVVPLLDAPVPQRVEQLVDVLRLVDALVPVAEQGIEVPKIIFENIPPRRLVREPQLAEQLVEVPTPSPAHVPVPRMEDQLVEVPQIETHIVPRSFFVGTDEHIWCQLRGPAGVYWWRCGTTHTQWTPPTGIHRQARAVYKYWPRVSGRPCDPAARVPAVQVVRVLCRDTVHRQSAGPSSCATEERFHSAVLEKGC